jgi:peptidoglycan/LPS O-acetylase OafA/YrhL
MPIFLFVVSGFLLFLPIAARGRLTSVRAYAIRRAARIVPAYLLCLAATLAVVGLIGHPPLPMDLAPAALAHVVFLQLPLRVSGFGINGIYWALSVLAAFWVLLPVIANRYVLHPLLGLGIAIAISVGWRLAVENEVRYEFFIYMPLFAADFAIGMTAVWTFVWLWRRYPPERLATPAAVGAALAVIAIVLGLYQVGLDRIHDNVFFFGESAWLSISIPAAFGVGMLSMCLAPAWVQWPLSNRLATWIGKVSYGLLLYHLLVLHLLLYYSFPTSRSFTSVLTLAAIVIPVGLLLGWLSYRFIEEPVRRRVRALVLTRIDRRTPVGEPAAP